MTDVILFATLFATYVVLQNNTNGGPTAKELFQMNGIYASTFILLTSSFTSGLALLAMHKGKKAALIGWLAITALLGATFITLEVSEFTHMVHQKESSNKHRTWQQKPLAQIIPCFLYKEPARRL